MTTLAHRKEIIVAQTEFIYYGNVLCFPKIEGRANTILRRFKNKTMSNKYGFLVGRILDDLTLGTIFLFNYTDKKFLMSLDWPLVATSTI